MHRLKPVDELIVEDDASRFLDGLSEEERRPKLLTNKLGPSGPSFTEEEVCEVFEIIAPE